MVGCNRHLLVDPGERLLRRRGDRGHRHAQDPYRPDPRQGRALGGGPGPAQGRAGPFSGHGPDRDHLRRHPGFRHRRRRRHPAPGAANRDAAAPLRRSLGQLRRHPHRGPAHRLPEPGAGRARAQVPGTALFRTDRLFRRPPHRRHLQEHVVPGADPDPLQQRRAADLRRPGHRAAPASFPRRKSNRLSAKAPPRGSSTRPRKS